MIWQIGNWALLIIYKFLEVLTKNLLKIYKGLICVSKPFPKYNEIQNLSLDRSQGNKAKYLPLG